MANQEGVRRATNEAPAGVIVTVAAVACTTLAWLLVYLGGLPLPWLPRGWIAGPVLATPLLAGVLVASAGRGWRAGTTSGALVGAGLLLSMWAFAPSRAGLPRPAILWAAIEAVAMPGLLGALGAVAARGFGARQEGVRARAPKLRAWAVTSTWELRIRQVALLSSAIALIWRGPRLVEAGGGAEAGSAAAGIADRWSWGVIGMLGRDIASGLWPAPVLWALLAATAVLGLRLATRRSARLPVARGPAPLVGSSPDPPPLLAPVAAWLLALAWLLAELALERPWSAIAGALCGGSLIVSLAVGGERRTDSARTGLARLVVAAILTLLTLQLALGSAQREQPAWLWVHVLFGVAVLLPVALHFAVRGWLLGGAGVDRRLSLVVGGGVTLQVCLGVGALLTPPASPRLDWLLVTLHLWAGVALLGGVSWLAAADSPRRR
ncbi:MAG TPA: hypothetical protein VMT85_22365 [Thermoanaerobaculia bacterium]|nr:hypothetical protein [Thermoanaerobaculia bacterium]